MQILVYSICIENDIRSFTVYVMLQITENVTNHLRNCEFQNLYFCSRDLNHAQLKVILYTVY